MKTQVKQSRLVSEGTEEEFLRDLLKKIGNRDLFPEKTASGRKFLDQLNANRQNLIP